MFIKKTSTKKNSATGATYNTYRLVRSYRNSAGKTRQETLLNLGSSFSIPENQWKILTDKVEQLLFGSLQLFEYELPIEIEREAKRIAKLLKTKNTLFLNVNIISTEVEEQDYQTVDINSLDTNDVNFIGNEHVAYHAANQLDLSSILLNAGFNIKQSQIAIASIISRLIVPGSEAKAHKYLTQDSALDELMGIDLSNLDIRQLFKISDLLINNKEYIEDKLYKKEKELFNLQEVITLFDITNTYFEGHPNSAKLALGRSKEKRSDCELVSLGLLLDSSGFPKKSKILPGNISEPSTLKDMLCELTNNSDTIVIMDAGIATKDNIAYLTEKHFKYIVVRRDPNLVMAEECNIVVKDTPNNKVTALLERDSNNTVNLYCHSTAKEAKCVEFNKKVSKRFEQELAKLNANLMACHVFKDIREYTGQSCAIIKKTGVFTNKPSELISTIIIANADDDIENFTLDKELTNLLESNKKDLNLEKAKTNAKYFHKLKIQLRGLFKDRTVMTKRSVIREYEQIAIKVGRLKQQYKTISYLYDISIIASTNKEYALKIDYKKNLDATNKKQAGIYCLTSNITNMSAESLWNTYTTLTEIESAFKSLKSELGMRPVYHHLEERIDGHLFISILAYHLLHTIRYQLKQNNINSSWEIIRNILFNHVRVTTMLNLKDGGNVCVRKTASATPDQALIYKSLGITSRPGKTKKSYIN